MLPCRPPAAESTRRMRPFCRSSDQIGLVRHDRPAEQVRQRGDYDSLVSIRCCPAARRQPNRPVVCARSAEAPIRSDFFGTIVLPNKSGNAVITIRSSASDAALPPAGSRIDPSYAPVLPKLRSGSSMPALMTAAGAHDYNLAALEFLPNAAGAGDIIELGDGSSKQLTLAAVPHDIVLDRVYIHGDAASGQKRAIALNSASTAVVNSYIADIKAVGQDSQALCGWNGPGPFTITNNYLEAAGENVMLGGSDPSIPNLVPSDITFRNNDVAKQPAWRTQAWSVKNIFELKNAQRVIVDHNTFAYNWLPAPGGVG